MANVINASMIEKYLVELGKDEKNIAEAGEAYESAKARLDVGLHRYVALRDFVAKQLGRSPYSHGVMWPTQLQDDVPEPGRFRFTGMSVGTAITEVLTESEDWLLLAEIIKRLSAGGLGFPEPVQARAVNAALLKTSGVKRSKNRHGEVIYYFVAKEEPDPEDAPSESVEPEEDLPVQSPSNW